MAKGLFINFTKEEVLAIQATAKALLLQGKTIMNYADSGTSAGKQFTMPIDQVLDECNYALLTLDPENTQGARLIRRSFNNSISSANRSRPFTY